MGITEWDRQRGVGRTSRIHDRGDGLDRSTIGYTTPQSVNESATATMRTADQEIARELKKGPSRLPRGRFVNGSHTETIGSSGVSSTVQPIDAESRARKLLRTHGESSESFIETPEISGKEKQDLDIGADRLRSMYRRLGVSENDAEAQVQVFLGNAVRYDHRDPPEVNRENALVGPASPTMREVVSNVFSAIRKKFPFPSRA